jgi:hypothetical protein
MRDLARALPALTGADRRVAARLLARPTDGQGDNLCEPQSCFFRLDPAFLSTAEGTHFAVHYYSSDLVQSPHAATPAYAQLVADTLDQVYAAETGQLGFNAPPADTGVVSNTNPDARTDIYLGDIGQLALYGYCAPDTESVQSSAYCVLDNDFAPRQFGAPPINSLRVTAAHEFFHAIQYGYDSSEATWFMEGSAVWMEDEVYPTINDYRQYVPASPIRRPLAPFTNNNGLSVYGAFTIFKFLAGYLHDRRAVREAWQRAAATPGNNSLSALDATFRAHHRSTRLAYSTFGAWNTLVRGGYPEAASYRPAGAWRVKTLTKRNRATGTWHLRVGRLANAPVVLMPATSLSRRSKLRITVNAPYLSVGGAATLQVRYRNGKVSLQQFGLNQRGDRVRTVGFNPRTVSSVVVVLTNADRSSSGPWSRAFTISAKAS